MAITAGCLVQNALKKLLQFGSVSNFLGYDALNDFFPRYSLRPNPECDNRHCREWAEKRKDVKIEEDNQKDAADLSEIVHEDGNEWNIEIEDGDDEAMVMTEKSDLEMKGLRRQYEQEQRIEVKNEETVTVEEEEDVDDLAKQLAALNNK